MSAREPVSRRSFLQGAAGLSAAAIAGRGVYGLLDGIVHPARAEAATAVARRQEQYIVDAVSFLLDNNTTVFVPPLYNDVFTAKLAPGTWTKAKLKSAQTRLEAALAKVEAPYPATGAGLTMVIAWGLPYFRSYVPGPWQAKAPRDLSLPLVNGQKQLGLLDAIRFPSDPADVVLEDNHVALKIRSDSSAILQSVEQQLFADVGGPAYVGDLLQLTSKRIGFLGRGFGTTSVVKQLALAAGVPGADRIPDKAQLSMGFTSTQVEALGLDNIVSFETLRGVTDQFPSGYFAHGCAMHLSHLDLDLATWYGKTYADRVSRMLSPSTPVPAETTVTLPNGPAQVATAAQVKADAARGVVGHNSALQMASRLPADTLDNYGRLRRKGSAVPFREDFNTLDNPFSWYVDANGTVHTPPATQPGLHFAVFVPTSGKFHGARAAMDGVLPDGTNLRTQYGLTDQQIGINSLMKATHRQNYLVPPRARRSFPLAELL
ncbi:MAG TPA: hypothetical protein VLM05_19665 [Mycobacteriales bacterium]|nr:hypothetical protein [Mycobacteriales bacterium]